MTRATGNIIPCPKLRLRVLNMLITNLEENEPRGSFWSTTLEAVNSNDPFANNYVTGFGEFSENIWIELNFEEVVSVKEGTGQEPEIEIQN